MRLLRFATATLTTLALGACTEDLEPTEPAALGVCNVSGIPAYTPVPIATQSIWPSVTAAPGETINNVLQGQPKQHYLVTTAPGQPRPTRVLLWLAGSGAEPHQFTKILRIGATAGYLGISLAYDNETSVTALCANPVVPQCNVRTNPTCGDEVRHEMLYGAPVYDSPCVAVPRADSIVNRIVRLVQYLDTTYPAMGMAQYLDPSRTTLAWDKWAIGGWSQGGAHAGLLAREHQLARTLYMSKGGDSMWCEDTTTDPDRDCDLNGDGVYDPNNDDERLIPAPDTYLPRATPAGRQFGAIHESESSWGYSRETFGAYGMGSRADVVRVDGLTSYTDFQCRNAFSTIAVPASGANDFHKSMAIDASMAVDGAGVPILAPMIYYALMVPVP